MLTFAPCRALEASRMGDTLPIRAVSQVGLDVGFQITQGEESFLAK
jgi:hypothetical protein